MSTSAALRAALAASALLALILVAPAASAQEDGGGAAAAGGLGQGWEEIDPRPGRERAMLHTDTLARLESWSTSMAEGDLEAFRSAFQGRLSEAGYLVGQSREVVIEGYPATLRRFSSEVYETRFEVAVIELYRRGVLWQFSAVFRAGEAMSDKQLESALTAFATSHL